MLRRPGAVRRWLVTLAVTALLAALPAVVTRWPVSGSTPGAATTLTRALRSSGVPFEGFVETTGTMQFPDIGLLRTTTRLLGGSSSIRVWQAAADRYRVDLLSTTGETDTYRAGDRLDTWDFDRQRLTVGAADDGPHLPAAYDMTPPELGRRLLSYADPHDVRAAGSVRTAGRRALRLVVTPHDRRTLVDRVTVDVDAATGLPLAVTVAARGTGGTGSGVGARGDAVTSAFAEVSLHAPATARLVFSASPGTRVRYDAAPTVTDIAHRVGPVPLPATLAGLPRRSSTGGVVTYGEGFSLVTVVPLSASDAASLVDRASSPLNPLQRTADGTEIALETPLVTGVIASMPDRGFVVAGTVTRATVDTVVHELASG